MIMTVATLKQRAPELAEVDFNTLQAHLEALESAIRKYTNNNFQNRNFRTTGQIVDGKLIIAYPYIKVDDTVQISESQYNNGLYVIGSDKPLYDENDVLVTKVEYPPDIQMGVVKMLKWQLKNEGANSGDTSKKDIQSETLSRYSVTYASDTTESDIDERFGVPKKYATFLRPYMKARF